MTLPKMQADEVTPKTKKDRFDRLTEAKDNCGSHSLPDAKPDSPMPANVEQPLRLLVVEDNRTDYELIVRHLGHCGFAPQARRVDSGLELRRALEEGSWDIIITDHKLARFSGAEALALIREMGSTIPALCVTGSEDPANMKKVLDAGACGLISKDLAPLCAAVRSALNRRSLRPQPPGPSTSGAVK